MKVEVQVISKESIKPSSPTPDHLRHYQLSFLDQLQPLVFMPLVLFYPKDDTTDANQNLSNEEQRDRIKKSLSEALTRFYPLAGRVKDNLYVDCNDEGVHYVEAEATCKLSEYLENPVPAELNKFLPYELDDVNELAAAIQLTFFNCGGLVVGLLMSHRVTDALSFFTFLRSWAAIACGGDHHTDSTSHRPPMDSATLFPPRHLAGFNSNIGITNENIVTKRFVFNASAIAKLRSIYSTENTTGIENPRSTRVEALSAFMWSRFMASTQPKDDSSSDKIYAILHAVNLRPRTDPPLPSNYFGNISRFALSVPSMDAEDGFYGIVKPVRDAIKKVDAEFVKMLQQGDAYLKFLRERSSNFIKGEVISLAFTSLCRFPVYEADFGWGNPAWVTSGNLKFKNLVSLFDTKSGDGIEAWVNLKEEDMAKFQIDKELLAYVSPAN